MPKCQQTTNIMTKLFHPSGLNQLLSNQDLKDLLLDSSHLPRWNLKKTFLTSPTTMISSLTEDCHTLMGIRRPQMRKLWIPLTVSLATSANLEKYSELNELLSINHLLYTNVFLILFYLNQIPNTNIQHQNSLYTLPLECVYPYPISIGSNISYYSLIYL